MELKRILSEDDFVKHVTLEKKSKFKVWFNERYIDVKGNEIVWDIHPDYKFFVHRTIDSLCKESKAGWMISECSTGFRVGIGHNTRKETLDEIYKQLKCVTPDNMEKAHRDSLAELANRAAL